MENKITKNHLLSWFITILLFVLGIVATSWVNLHARLRTIELDIQTIKVKIDTHEDEINEVRRDIKEIKGMLHQIDKKIK